MLSDGRCARTVSGCFKMLSCLQTYVESSTRSGEIEKWCKLDNTQSAYAMLADGSSDSHGMEWGILTSLHT